MRIHVEAVHFSADQKLLDLIEKKISKLEQYYDHIIDVHVVLKLENSGQVRDKVMESRLNVPGDTLICKVSDKKYEAALDIVADNLKRQLIKYKERSRQNGGLNKEATS
jgi:putative sigma-54 modulation protein